jgi:hypothetical protein
MDERTMSGATERPVLAGARAADSGGPPHLADPRALTILTTEHWSLLTTRSLVYNEAFSRAAMFLTFLSATLVALGFVSQGGTSNREFLLVAAALLGFDLVIGLATLGRVSSASAEEFRALQGMNRLRHAYLEMAPTLEPYFSTSAHDDLLGVLSIYGATPEQPSILGEFIHGLTTIPGMIGMITAAVGGALGAVVALLFGGATMVAIVAGLLAFALLFAAIWASAARNFGTLEQRLEVRFPTPPRSSGPAATPGSPTAGPPPK